MRTWQICNQPQLCRVCVVCKAMLNSLKVKVQMQGKPVCVCACVCVCVSILHPNPRTVGEQQVAGSVARCDKTLAWCNLQYVAWCNLQYVWMFLTRASFQTQAR